MTQDVRTALHSAYTFVRSVEINKAYAVLTLDHMLSEQIAKLKSSSTSTENSASLPKDHISRYDQLEDLKKQLDDAVRAVKEAGDDPDKLKAIGIYEADEGTKDEEAMSLNAEQVSE